jgi:hypothetical protein
MSLDSVEQVDTLLNQCEKVMLNIGQDMAYIALSETDLLLKILDEEFKKTHKLDKLQKKIDHFLLNQQNSRLLRLQQQLKSETEISVEYYSQDIGNDERLFYAEELEKDVNELYGEIRSALATIIRHKLSGDISF